MNCLTTLLPHQIKAVDKLLPIRVGALFMDMGTGKTRTAIEFAARREAQIDRVVWFCPVSLMETVRQEILKHTDRTDVYIFDEKTSARSVPQDHLFYIVGIESMSASNRAVLAARCLITSRTFVIVDESSYIKGNWAIRTRRITAMSEPARYRMILTGTPISQGVVDLFAQMRFLSPKILGYRSFYSFANNHLVYSKNIPGKIERVLDTDVLAERIQPYVYQVTKEECLDLPGKLHETRWAKMTGAQINAYCEAKEIFSETASRETEFWKLSHAIFRLFTSLQEIACGFWNRRGDNNQFHLHEYENNRLGLLLDVVKEIEEEKVVIWSKFQYNLLRIGQALASECGPESVSLLHGGMRPAERSRSIEQFRAGARFLVASPGVGGHGLTLNEARYVIFFSNGFKYSERIQAEDRCHRLGQERAVTYINVACTCGIEERILKALARKKNVVEEFRREVEAVKDEAVAREKFQKIIAEL